MPTVKKTLKEHDERRVSIRVRAGHPAPPIAPSPLLNAMQKTAEDIAKIVCKEIHKLGLEKERLFLLEKEAVASRRHEGVKEKLDGVEEPLCDLLEILNTINNETNTLKWLLGIKEKTTPIEAKVDQDLQDQWFLRSTSAPWTKYKNFGYVLFLDPMKKSLGNAKQKINLKLPQVDSMIRSLSSGRLTNTSTLTQWKGVKSQMHLLIRAFNSTKQSTHDLKICGETLANYTYSDCFISEVMRDRQNFGNTSHPTADNWGHQNSGPSYTNSTNSANTWNYQTSSSSYASHMNSTNTWNYQTSSSSYATNTNSTNTWGNQSPSSSYTNNTNTANVTTKAPVSVQGGPSLEVKSEFP